MESIAGMSDSLTSIVLLFLEDLETPVADSVAKAIREKRWMDLAGMKVDPRLYSDPLQYCRDAAAVNLLRKFKSFPTPSGVKEAAALEKWWSGEKACYVTNQRLLKYLPEFRNFGDVDQAVLRHIDAIRKIVINLIGHSPPSLVEGRFGPGATFRDKGQYVTVPDKMSSDPTLTREAVWFLPQWFATQWGADFASRHGKLEFIPGNRYSSVPKTSLEDRSIAVEPSINVFFQLGLGKALRKRLLKPSLHNDGWNLDVAAERHRQTACDSSLTQEFATLDLSNASDTVAYNLVKLLLPPQWFEALDMLRSPKTLVKGQWVKLEKFSSMGNGFTFELETVLFAAIALHACACTGVNGVLGRNVMVFGDDIILPDGCVKELLALFAFLGFQVNTEKSFFGDVPFRESCGGDFLFGAAVRSYYLKDEPDEPRKLISIANGFKSLYTKLDALHGTYRVRGWLRVLDSLPLAVRRARGPVSLGDVVIHDVEERWTTRERHGIRYLRALVPFKRRTVAYGNFRPGVVLACATYGVGNEGTPVYGRPLAIEGVTPRNGLLSHRVGWIPWS
jgi:hypothetical protein